YEQPASVIKYAGGERRIRAVRVSSSSNQTLPRTLLRIARWSCMSSLCSTIRPTDSSRGIATFSDVAALVDEASTGAHFAGLPVLTSDPSYFAVLGINALELLPPADSFYKREWGYDTSHYLAPDAELGHLVWVKVPNTKHRHNSPRARRARGIVPK